MIQKGIQLLIVFGLLSCSSNRYIKKDTDFIGLDHKNYMDTLIKLPMNEVENIKSMKYQKISFNIEEYIKKDFTMLQEIIQLEDILFNLDYINRFSAFEGTYPDPYEEYLKQTKLKENIYFIDRFSFPNGMIGLKVLHDINFPAFSNNIYLIIIKDGYLKSIIRTSYFDEFMTSHSIIKTSDYRLKNMEEYYNRLNSYIDEKGKRQYTHFTRNCYVNYKISKDGFLELKK